MNHVNLGNRLKVRVAAMFTTLSLQIIFQGKAQILDIRNQYEIPNISEFTYFAASVRRLR